MDITIENLTKRFDDQIAVKNLSLEIPEGKIYGFIGANGAGKTTLIKLLMGLYPVTSGQILVNEMDIADIDGDAYRSRFGTVFQDLQVFAIPLVENVLMRRPVSDADYSKAERALKNAAFCVGDVSPLMISFITV